MTTSEADENERVFVEKCKVLRHQLQFDARERIYQPQQEYLSITSEELLIIEHGCIYPDKDECIGKHCKYHDPNPSFRDNIVCLLNEHDVADVVRSRATHTSPPAPVCPHFGIARISYQDGDKNEWCCLNPLTEARKAAAAKAAREKATHLAVENTLIKFYNEIKAEDVDNCGYIDLDAVENIYCTLMAAESLRAQQGGVSDV